jgi:outer membrane receptor protein involved in Fe transport
MVKKFFYVFMALVFICAFTITTTPVYAQEEEEEVVEDVADISLEDLLNVEITTAGKKAQRVADIPASVVLITRADIERYGYQTLDEVLENVPGLFGIDQRFADGMVFGVRGFWAAFANNIIILINGVRMERIRSDGGVYTAQNVPVESIDRIEVIRGPMSVIYGTNAFFGAINIITNDAENPGLVSVSYGLEKTARLSARAAYINGDKDFSLAFNAGYYDTAGPDIPFEKMSTQDLSFFTPFDSTEGLLGNQTKFFNFSGSYKGFYSNFTIDQALKQFFILFPPSTPDGTHYNRTYTSASFGYKADISEQFSLDGRFTYHKGSTRGAFSLLIPPGFRNVGGDTNYLEDYEVDVTAIFTPSKQFSLTTGLYYKKIIDESLQGIYPFFGLFYRLGMDDPIENRSMFMQADFSLGKALKLVLGFRLEQYLEYSAFYLDLGTLEEASATFEHDKIELIPRVAAIFYLNDKNIIKLLYGKAINVPTLFQTTGQAVAGQPVLEPEFIQTFEFNYLAAFSDKFNLNLSVFYNKFDDLIVSQPILDENGVWISGFFTNAGKMETIGGELTIQTRLAENFTLELSGTLQKTKDKRELFKDIEVAYSPKQLGYFKAAYSFGNKKGSIAVTGRYVGAMKSLWDYSIQNPDGTFGNRIARDTDGYFVLGASLRFDNLFGKGYFLAISGNNLLDTEYYFPNYTFNPWADLGLYGYGRRVMATIGKKFVPVPMP